MPDDCIFCKIVAGDVKSDVVLDRGRIYAFRDVNPQAPTHFLIVPKEHLKDITELTPAHGDLLAEMILAANELAKADGISDSGYRVVFNVGPDAGQTVFHLHLHVLGGRQMKWPPG